ncbi:MAG TPA: hypothetical protein VJQ08_03770 [Candidatus Dormibacteraeota bacterium]|nr:hypothetical protein [Candidatus Dormibacteraeota bacterium]
MSLNTVLLVVALIAFALAAIGLTWRKTDLIAVGLAVWSLSFLLGRISSIGISTILLLLAFIAFVAAAVGWKYRKLNLIAIGLALWVLSSII